MVNASQGKYNSWLANHPGPGIGVSIIAFAACLSLELLPGKYIPSTLTFVCSGIVAMYLMPYALGLPNGRKTLRQYCADIRLLPLSPVGRNVLIGLLMAGLTLSSILAASLLTGHYAADWSEVPRLRLVKGLTRGVWEEVFFRGIALVILMRIFPLRKAVLLDTLIFSLAHLSGFSPDKLIDVASIFFMGLLFLYLVLKTNSLLPAIVFHYVHDIFVNLVQTTPGANEAMKSTMLYGFLWVSLIVGGFIAKYIVEHWPGKPALEIIPPAKIKE